MSDTVGVQIGPGRFVTVAGTVRRIIDDPAIVGGIAESAQLLRDVIGPHAGQRLSSPFPPAIQEALVTSRGRVDAALSALRAIDTDVEDAKQRKLRAQQMATRLIEQIDIAIGAREGYVAFVSGSARAATPRDRPARRRPGAVGGHLGSAHRDPHQRHDAHLARRTGSASIRRRSTSSTSAARSTTSTTRSCTARSTCPIRGLRSGPPPPTTRSPR